MRNLVLAATALTALSASAAHAVDVKLYGIVNKAYMGYDDGHTTESTVVDNNNQSTRFGFAGEQKLDNGLTASVLFETEMASNPSNAITQAGTGTFNSQANTPTNASPSFAERMARVGLAGEWGAVFLGQQDVATDDVYGSHDLAAAGSIVNPNMASFGGGLVFQRKVGNTYSNVTVAGTNLTTGGFLQGNDGSLVSADAIRYNSPVFNGFNGSLSISQGGNADASVRYAGEFGGFKVDSALGHTWVNNGSTSASNFQTGTTAGSASVRHNSGLGATVAYTTQDFDHKTAGVKDPEGYYAKVGYDWSAYGVAAEYGNFKNPVASSTKQELTGYGVGGQYNLADGVTAGALYRNLSADVAGVSNVEDINIFAVSLGVKF
jgi:predicted porin